MGGIRKNIIAAVLVAGGFISAWPADTGERPMAAQDIVEKMNSVINVDSSEGRMSMTIITSSGEERTFIYDSYSKNRGEKNLIRYIEPSRARGQAILMLNNADDIWAYFPRTGRVRKLATHAKRQKMEGSDFSYEDMGSGDAFLDDYTSRLLGEEEKEGYMCHKLELERKQGSDAGYSRLVIWVIKENYFPVAIQYYDLDDSRLLLKELIQYDIRMIENIPTGMKIVMYNRTDDTKTVMEILKVDYDAELGDELFTERGLLK